VKSRSTEHNNNDNNSSTGFAQPLLVAECFISPPECMLLYIVICDRPADNGRYARSLRGAL